jgi:drug/metabolite transporter (DMT)-like permease
VLGAAASESVFNILSRAAAAGASARRGGRRGDDRSNGTGRARRRLALALCIVPALFESPSRGLRRLDREWAALVWYGVCATALAYICWYAGIKRSPAMTAAAFSGMMPLTSMLLAAAALGERAGWPQWAGGLLVAAGMVLLAADGRRGGARIKSAKALTQEKAAEK